MFIRNEPRDFDASFLKHASINVPCLESLAAHYSRSRVLSKTHELAYLLRAIPLIDLTTLSGDDTPSNVNRLCVKAVRPLNEVLLHALADNYGFGAAQQLTTGAVCVYPAQVSVCAARLALAAPDAAHRPHLASVVTGFPSGQYPLATRLAEIRAAVAAGADELDVVINRTLALQGDWRAVHAEVRAMREACGRAHLKVILAVGELATYDNVYRASMAAMLAGADFVKTSTGKESVNSTLAVGVVMLRAVREYYRRTGVKVGFKPAGGIRTSADALRWMLMVREEMSQSAGAGCWLQPALFRFGASGLLADVERRVHLLVTGRSLQSFEIPQS